MVAIGRHAYKYYEAKEGNEAKLGMVYLVCLPVPDPIKMNTQGSMNKSVRNGRYGEWDGGTGRSVDGPGQEGSGCGARGSTWVGVE